MMPSQNNELLAQRQRLFSPADPLIFQFIHLMNNEIREEEQAIETAFQELHRALQRRCYLQTKRHVHSLKKRDIDKLDALILAEEAAYNAWASLLPTVPASYDAFVTALEKKQHLLYLARHRQTLLNSINLDAKLIVSLSTLCDDDVSLITHFQKKWAKGLNIANDNNNKKARVEYAKLLHALNMFTCKYLKLKEREQYHAILEKSLHSNIMVLFESLAKIDTFLGLMPQTTLISARDFADFTVARFHADAGKSLSRYEELIDNLRKGNVPIEILQEMQNSARIRRDAADTNKSQTETFYYAKLICALQGIINMYGYQLINYQEDHKNMDIETVIHYIETHLIPCYKNYEQVLQQQADYTEQLSQQVDIMRTQEIEPLYKKMQEEIEQALIARHVQYQSDGSRIIPSAA